MSNFIRLKQYTMFLNDGKSSFKYAVADKKEVFVALLLGVEPLRINEEKDFLDVEKIILKMASNITKAKKESKKKKQSHENSSRKR